MVSLVRLGVFATILFVPSAVILWVVTRKPRCEHQWAYENGFPEGIRCGRCGAWEEW